MRRVGGGNICWIRSMMRMNLVMSLDGVFVACWALGRVSLWGIGLLSLWGCF